MDNNEKRALIEKFAPMYPEIRVVLNAILDDMNTIQSVKEPEEIGFKDELIAINGIGKKEAEDIIAIYPNRHRLINDIRFNNRLPFHANVQKLLIAKYGTTSK